MAPDTVILRNSKWVNGSHIGRLAVRLARESYFGKEEMKKCTVFGCQDKPALPRDTVEKLKMKVLSLFPQFAAAPHEFEPLWSKCVGAINHHCAGLRSKASTSFIVVE